MPQEFQYFRSSDVRLPVRIRILNAVIDLQHVCANFKVPIDPCPDLYVSLALFANGKRLTVDRRTSYCNNQKSWNQWLELPIKYSELPLSTMAVMTIFTMAGPRTKIPLAGTSLPLFNGTNALRKGKQRLVLWPNVEGDGSEDTMTPGKYKGEKQIDHIERVLKKYERGQVVRNEWLDKLVLAEINKIQETEKLRAKEGEFWLFVELPTTEFPVLFHEKEYRVPMPAESLFKEDRLVVVHDPAKKEGNPVANKQLKLVTSNWRKYPADPNLRPSIEERDRIQKILHYPITKHLSIEDKDLLWKFRYFLTGNKKALTKFLRCVDWDNPQESKQAAGLISQWEPVEISDALELLSKRFTSHTVRDYAVSRLEEASDEEFLHYSLQLVQALRYDSAQHQSKLTSFLFARAVKNKQLRNFLYWYLKVECGDPRYKEIYEVKLKQFRIALANLEDGSHILEQFRRHEEIISWLNTVYRELRANKGKLSKKVSRFSEMLSPNGEFSKLGSFPFPPVPLPLEPSIMVQGIIYEKVKIFSSAMEPLGFKFITNTAEREYQVIFKSGDDMRQDQLIIQMISLMDNLLKKENLDLKLSPYRVLPFSHKEGMVQFVKNSSTIRTILKDYNNDIHNYLRECHPNQSAPFGIDPEVINNFVKSCAGYCVITFILCVGDRHLDNLLITTSGLLFHIDFGYIGRDPKPYPPPMKLCPEMVAAMGGEDSKHFKLFKQYCVEAYNILRKNANLILNLISLMQDADIPDIANERCLLQIQDKFQLEKNDEEAGESFQKLMQESVDSLFPRISERFHNWKQYWDNR